MVAFIVNSAHPAKDDQDHKHSFTLVKDVPEGLPKVSNPLSSTAGIDYTELLLAAIPISLLGYLEMIAIGKAFILKNGGMAEVQLDPSQELRALGVGNVIASFFQSFPNTGSFSKTAVNAASGVESPLGGLFTSLVVILALLLLTKGFYWIPKAALGAIIIMSVVNMIDLPGLRVIKRTKPIDLIVWSTSFFACLLWSLEFGILLAIGVSVVLDTITTSSQQLNRVKKTAIVDGWQVDKTCKTSGKPSAWAPRFVETKGNHGFVAIKINGALTFSMARKFEDRVANIVEYLRSGERMSAIAIDMTVCPDLDFTGTMAVKKALSLSAPRTVPADSKDAADIYNSGTVVYMVGLSDAVRKTLRRAGVFSHAVEHGGWPLVEAVDLDTALMAFPADSTSAESVFPGRWNAPLTRPSDEVPGTVAKGQDTEAWLVYDAGKKGDPASYKWIKAPGGGSSGGGGGSSTDGSEMVGGPTESLPDEDVGFSHFKRNDDDGSDGSLGGEDSAVVLPPSSAVTWHGGGGFAAEAARQLNTKFRNRHSGASAANSRRGSKESKGSGVTADAIFVKSPSDDGSAAGGAAAATAAGSASTPGRNRTESNRSSSGDGDGEVAARLKASGGKESVV